ncbi:hypothetical protein QJQ45_006247 [Haematococcus lacustris]|nr:hypothetical protein QJQ45_006247 [Haematococcus lacustris]
MDRDVAGSSPAPGPAAAPGCLTAAARVEAAGNGVDPLPDVSWGRYLPKRNVRDNGETGGTDIRCFEVLYKPIVQDLGLDLKAGAAADILVALALEEPREDSPTDADLDRNQLQLHCVAKPNTEKIKWRFNTANMKKKVRDWVKSVGKQLTGNYKAKPEQHGPHLLVLEVRPLPKAAAQAACATPATACRCARVEDRVAKRQRKEDKQAAAVAFFGIASPSLATAHPSPVAAAATPSPTAGAATSTSVCKRSVGSITISLASLEARSACGQTATMQQEEAKQYAADKATDKGRHLQAVALYRCKLASNKLPPTTSKLLKNQLQELWAVVGNGQPTVKPVRNMHIADWLDALAMHMSPVTN